jgi:hypothetical protein
MGTCWARKEGQFHCTTPGPPAETCYVSPMKLRLLLPPAAVLALYAAGWLAAQPAADPLVEGLRLVEVASVADAAEQLYGQRIYMSHDMRPISTARFAGPAVTVLLKKEEHHEGAAASQGMLDAIDAAPPGSVYVSNPVPRDGWSLQKPLPYGCRWQIWRPLKISQAERDLRTRPISKWSCTRL